ncbi:hypothetical protein [Streptomyces sp. LUP47B]|uniref:hypothetical protein n=1 Tax=Streptomyces sp. LUP47B TaxID=1890286 RepID=UPI0008521386|nr:hypothetical protein [Streptomyces sp. LUP47B]
MEHTTAGYKRWGSLQRFTRRRETYTETQLAIAGVLSNRSTRTATHRKFSTELGLARQAAC